MTEIPKQQYQAYLRDGWCVFDFDNVLLNWVETTLPVARKTISNPENDVWFRHGRTWFAGVNILPNDKLGAVAGGEPVDGEAMAFIRHWISNDRLELDRAQVSVYYPGYPQASSDENTGCSRVSITT